MEKEIIKGNKLIAEFMDAERELIVMHDLYRLPNKPAVKASELIYHTSWDWLMPVVEKIESMQGVKGWFYKIDIINRNEVECSAENTPICYIHGNDGKSKIEAVWLAVVAFIKWHNEQK